MVDALNEARRSLIVNGMLVDLRPSICHPGIEALTSNEMLVVGYVDDSSAASDSNAADAAIRRSQDAGWFAPCRHFEFDFEHYWDTVSEMAAYLASRRHPMDVLPSLAEVEEAYDAVAAAAQGKVRLRCRWRVILNSYVRHE